MDFKNPPNSKLDDIILQKLNTIQKIILKNNKPFLDINEASEYLGISKNTLYVYTSKSIIPHYKLQGRKIYFKVDELDEFILNQKNRVESNRAIDEEASTRIVLKKGGR